jgi:hypothetical protein
MKILVATAFSQGTSLDDYHHCIEGTTAMVIESPMTRDDVLLAFRTSLAAAGWPAEAADEVADDNLVLAAQLPPGAIIVRKLDSFFLRGALLPAPSPEQR